MRRIYVAATAAGLSTLLGGWLALGAAGQDQPPRAVRAVVTTAPAQATAELPPLPTTSRPHVVQPVAGEATAAPGTVTAPDPGLNADDHAPTAPASDAVKGPHPAHGGSNAVSQAIALGNGVALPPLEAPDAVKQIIEAGNGIARTPYIWGGGHGKWLDKGYDCSGSVSFALASAGLLSGPLTSGLLMSWGEPGKGKWVTIYASPTHVFMEVAGIRFDTGAQRVTGSRWINYMRPTDGFVARHPAGL
jgi:cell wall-associated NlpC family hydrolase